MTDGEREVLWPSEALCACVCDYRDLRKSKAEGKHLLVNPCLLSRSFGSQGGHGLSDELSLLQSTALQTTRYVSPTDSPTYCSPQA